MNTNLVHLPVSTAIRPKMNQPHAGVALSVNRTSRHQLKVALKGPHASVASEELATVEPISIGKRIKTRVTVIKERFRKEESPRRQRQFAA